MPESYFHVRCARASYRGSGARGYHIPAVMLGAAGPDVFYYHMGLPALLPLGRRMHAERCGPFLTALARRAKSRLCRSYVLGFLSHNAVDATMHPWVERQTETHAVVESALDSHYLLLDKGRSLAMAKDCAPRLGSAELLELGGLLQGAVREVYGMDISRRALARMLGDFRRWKTVLRDGCGLKCRLAGCAERLLRLERGSLSGHCVTGKPLNGQARPEDLVEWAEGVGAEMMIAAEQFWAGEIGPLELSSRIGDHSYIG